jgi:hypothetical protein
MTLIAFLISSWTPGLVWQQYQPLQYVDRQYMTKSPQKHYTLWASTLIRLADPAPLPRKMKNQKQRHQAWWKRCPDNHQNGSGNIKFIPHTNLNHPLCFPTIRTKWFYAYAKSHFLHNPKYHHLQSWLSLMMSPWSEVKSNNKSNSSKMVTDKV